MNIIHYQGHTIQVIRKPYRRKITLIARSHGPLRLLINQSLPEIEIQTFLESSKQWLEKIYYQRQELEENHPLPKFQPGEKFPFLGEDRELLNHLVSPEISAEDFRRKLKDFYIAEGRIHIFDTIEMWSSCMGLYPLEYRMRYQKSRWGACNSRMEITINLKLAAAPQWVMDYVVVHELAHLEVFNHSKAFWDLVTYYYPEHKKAQKWLKDHQPRLDRFFAHLMRK